MTRTTKSFDFNEFFEYSKKFKSLQADFDNFLKNWITEQAARIVADAKRNTPPHFSRRPEDSKSTGHFRNSFYWGDYHKTSNSASVEVGNSVDYASFLEYGFHIKGGAGRQQIVGFKDGNFILTKAVNKQETKMKEQFDKAFTAFLKQKGIL